MAALPEARLHPVPLTGLGARALEPVLEEVCEAWERRLHWNYRDTAELIRSYTEMRALEGVALVDGGVVAGYCYWIHEGAKTLIGDFFVRRAWQSAEHENLLLRAALRALRKGGRAWSGARRVEAQLMQLATRSSALLPGGPRPAAYPRLFMLRPTVVELPPARAAWRRDLEFRPWSMRWCDRAAALITEAYDSHIDSEINDQYRSHEGSARFVQNIVQYPGCGVFLPGASVVAANRAGELVGLAMATRVAPHTGHLAQLCLDAAWRGSGLGFELLRRIVGGLRDAGIREVSLTVTEQNTRAVTLYERTGFHAIHRFDALVWE